MNTTEVLKQTEDAGESCFCCANYTDCGVEMELLVEEHGGHPLDLMKITCGLFTVHEWFLR
jgi:hypothetical protein